MCCSHMHADSISVSPTPMEADDVIINTVRFHASFSDDAYYFQSVLMAIIKDSQHWHLKD